MYRQYTRGSMKLKIIPPHISITYSRSRSPVSLSFCLWEYGLGLAVKYRLVENLWGRKPSRISRFVAIHESFLDEIWGMASFGSTSEQPEKVLSAKIFSHESFLLYGIIIQRAVKEDRTVQ